MGLTPGVIKNGAKAASEAIGNGAKAVASSAKGLTKPARFGRIAVGSLAGAGAGGIAGIATGADEDNMKAMVLGGAVAGGIGGAVSTLGMEKNLEIAGGIAGKGHVGTGFAPLKHIQVKNTGEMLGDIALVEERATGQIAMDLGQYNRINAHPISNLKEAITEGASVFKQTFSDASGNRIRSANRNINVLEGLDDVAKAKYAENIGSAEFSMQNNGQMSMFL